MPQMCKSNILRYAFVYLNIVHMEVDDAIVSKKKTFVLIYFCFQLIYRLFFDTTQITPLNDWELSKNQVLRSQPQLEKKD